jgi:hypothetical protein
LVPLQRLQGVAEAGLVAAVVDQQRRAASPRDPLAQLGAEGLLRW